MRIEGHHGRFFDSSLVLGTMHALTKQYQPAELAWKRPDGIEDSLPVVEGNLPASEAAAVKKYHALCDHRSYDVRNIDNRWCEQFMRNRKEKIEHDVPCIDSFSAHL